MPPSPDIAKLVERIYGAAEDVHGWHQPLTAIADALGARAMSFHIIDAAGRRAPFLLAPRTDPQWQRAYAERWAPSNIVRERGLALPAGAVYEFEDLMARRDFEVTAFYNEFWARQGLRYALFANVAKGRDALAGIGFYRSSREDRFEPAAARLLGELAPHLQRAVKLNLLLGRAEMEREAIAAILNRCAYGAMLVEADAGILFANAAAEALLHEGTALRAKDGRLAAPDPSRITALLALIESSEDGMQGGTLALPRRDGRTVAVMVLPLPSRSAYQGRQPAAIVLAKDPAAIAQPTREEIGLLFGLTPAQAALAREILRGDGIAAAARRLGISRATARTHLLECFRRTGTSRQAELVRAILQHHLPHRGAP